MQRVLDRREFLKDAAKVNVALALGYMAILEACGNSSSTSGRAVKFGLFTDTSGTIAFIGAAHALAYQLAVQDVNKAGGVLGQPLQTSLVDSQSDPQAAIPKVNQLIESDHVDALVGGIYSSTRDAVLPIIADRANRIYMYPMTYEGGACNKNLFLTAAVPQQNFLPAVKHVLDQGARRWMLFGHDYAFPHVANGLGKTLIQNAGGNVIADKYYPLDATDFSDAIRAITAANPDAIVNNLTPPGMFTFYKQLGASGWHKPVVATGLDETAVGPIGAANLETTVVGLDYLASANSGSGPSIVDRFQQASGGKVPYSPGLGNGAAYRAVRFLAAAINKAGSTDTAKVRSALVGLSLDDLPGGSAKIGSDHHTAMHMYVAGFNSSGSLQLINDLGVVDPNQSCSF
jgi:ABC-type branched-subunit amino acid transport system substrate-binding protein